MSIIAVQRLLLMNGESRGPAKKRRDQMSSTEVMREDRQMRLPVSNNNNSDSCAERPMSRGRSTYQAKVYSSLRRRGVSARSSRLFTNPLRY